MATFANEWKIHTIRMSLYSNVSEYDVKMMSLLNQRCPDIRDYTSFGCKKVCNDSE